jgi:hypothetical protein
MKTQENRQREIATQYCKNCDDFTVWEETDEKWLGCKVFKCTECINPKS